MSDDELIARREAVRKLREHFARVADRHINMSLCKQLFPEHQRGAFSMASHLADDLRNVPDSEIHAILTTLEASEERARVERVETLPIAHPFDDTETPPIWRVVVGEYCADFDYEQAARNFAGAINAAPSPQPQAPSEESRMTLRQVMNSAEPLDWPGGDVERDAWYAGYDAAVAEQARFATDTDRFAAGADSLPRQPSPQ